MLSVAPRLFVGALITFCDDIIADFQPMSWEWGEGCTAATELSNNILTATVRLELYFKQFMQTSLKYIFLF